MESSVHLGSCVRGCSRSHFNKRIRPTSKQRLFRGSNDRGGRIRYCAREKTSYDQLPSLDWRIARCEHQASGSSAKKQGLHANPSMLKLQSPPKTSSFQKTASASRAQRKKTLPAVRLPPRGSKCLTLAYTEYDQATSFTIFNPPVIDISGVMQGQHPTQETVDQVCPLMAILHKRPHQPNASIVISGQSHGSFFKSSAAGPGARLRAMVLFCTMHGHITLFHIGYGRSPSLNLLSAQTSLKAFI